MTRVAVFIDAGYFWAQLCKTLTGGYDSRSQAIVDYAILRAQMLGEVAAQFPKAELLRVYWYDGPGSSGTKTAEHNAIDALDDFKLRLGTRNFTGQQKGVDGLIIADLVSLTQQRAISSAMLVTGDADITPGVVAAQGMGLRVHLLNIGTVGAVSPLLAAEVDMKRAWGLQDVAKFASQNTSFVASVPLALPADAGAPDGASVDFAVVAKRVHDEILAGPLCGFLQNRQPNDFHIPPEIDKFLLRSGRVALDRSLTDGEKPQLRNELRKLINA